MKNHKCARTSFFFYQIKILYLVKKVISSKVGPVLLLNLFGPSCSRDVPKSSFKTAHRGPGCTSAADWLISGSIQPHCWVILTHNNKPYCLDNHVLNIKIK